MTTKQRHVDAEFAGEMARFDISRLPIHLREYLERDGSLISMLQRLVAGMWTVKDISSVLEAAYQGKHRGVTWLSNEHVARILTEEPPGQYAALAANVLQAYLFGIDPDEPAEAA